jgi:hypothetical protein
MATQEDIKDGADTLLERIDEFTENLTDVSTNATNKQTEFHNQFRMLKPSMEEFSMANEIIAVTDSLEKMDAEIKRIASNNSIRTPPVAKQGQQQQGGSRRKTRKIKNSSKKTNKSKKAKKVRKQ